MAPKAKPTTGGPPTAGAIQLKPWQPAAPVMVPGQTADYKQLERILNEDWLLRLALKTNGSLTLSMIGDYQHPDARIQEFVRGALDYMRGTWHAALSEMMQAAWYGFSVCEIIWETEPSGPFAGQWLMKGLRPLPQAAFYPEGFDPAKGLAQEEIFYNRKAQTEARLEPGQYLHWAFESASNPYGNPLARSLWTLAAGRSDAYRWWLTGLENMGQPLIVEIVPDRKWADPLTKLETNAAEQAQSAWNRTQGGSVIIRTAGNDDGSLPRFEVLRTAGWTTEFKDYFGYNDRAVFLGYGIPPLLVMEPEHASRAQATVQDDLLDLTLRPNALDFADAVMIGQVVKPLLDYNLGEQDDYGEFLAARMVDEQTVAQTLTALGSIGAFGVLSEPFYKRIQAQFPNLLPAWEEIEEVGGVTPALPPGVTP